MHIAALASALLFTLLRAVNGRLLQVNEWHEIPMVAGLRAKLDLSLFMSCERFSLVFASDLELDRLTFVFDGERVQKVEVDTPEEVDLPFRPPVVGGCREVDRKHLRLNLSSGTNGFDVQLDSEVVIRPRRNGTENLTILLPQKSACCLIRGILLMDNEMEFTPTPPKKHKATRFRTDKPSTRQSSTSSKSSDFQRLFTGLHIDVTPKTTTGHNFQLISWTDMVNREWSIPFLVCSISVLVVMVTMVGLGLALFLYLQTRPPPSKRFYSIED